MSAPAGSSDAVVAWHRGRRVADRAIAFLRSRQNDEGGWSGADRPLPAVSALALTGLILDPRIDDRDPDVARGTAWLLGFVRDDGGIYGVADGVAILPSYNTSICVSYLARVRTPEAARAVQGGVSLIRAMQWQEGGTVNPEAPATGEPVPESHPFHGGWGYGRHGRPDLSNTQFALQALEDAGVSSADPAVRRALVFLRRVQMHRGVNEMAYSSESEQGGFIYATVPDGESVDGAPGQSQAGTIQETLPGGASVSSLRAYGSMTYAGFKSLVYADLAPDDERVRLAVSWLAQHYTLEENPGMGDQGFYYYLLMLARALEAGDGLLLADGSESAGALSNWRVDLVRRLDELQLPDGSFAVRHPRWMEDDRVLITAYALIALQHAMR